MLKFNNKIPTYIEIDGKSAASISIKNHIVWRKEQPEPTANYFYIQPLADTIFDYTNFEFIGENNVLYSLDQNNWTTFETEESTKTIKVEDFYQNDLVYIVIDNYSYELFLMRGILSYCITNLFGDPKDALSLSKQDENYHYFVGNYSSVKEKDEYSFNFAGIDEYDNVMQLSMNNIDIFMLEQEGSAVVCSSGDGQMITDIQYTRSYDNDTAEFSGKGPKNSVNITANNKMYLRTINDYNRPTSDTETHIKVDVNYNIGGPLDTLIKNSAYWLFSNDTNIVSAKELIVQELKVDSLFDNMFRYCTNLIEGPKELPATTLTTYCYHGMFFGCSSLVKAPALPAKTAKSYCYQNMFLNCTSLVEAPELPATTLSQYCYSYMFNGCTSLVNAPELPAASLAIYCYLYMFQNCTSLVDAPALPAIRLIDRCYLYMFSGCTSLVEAPELPATSVSSFCYSYMFNGCTSLVNAPALPATSFPTSNTYSYDHMFNDCTSLVNAPALPATALNNYCYLYMFRNCTSLVNAPTLPATRLATRCYLGMFQGCSSLEDAPALPATTLATNCYLYMFSGCTSLVNAPALPATELATQCYFGMFQGCSSLVDAPELPATTLASGCYQAMFNNCINLVNAPELPAVNLISQCYKNMFNGCSSLKKLYCNARYIGNVEITTNISDDWLNNVPNTEECIFYKNSDWAGPTSRGGNTVPTNWIIANWGEQPAEYFYIQPLEDTTFDYTNFEFIGENNVLYSLDKNNWTTFETGSTQVNINANDKLYLRTINDYERTEETTHISVPVNYNIGGKLETIIKGKYARLFESDTHIINAKELILPDVLLEMQCQNMFNGCSSLVEGPSILPAMQLTLRCYDLMFYNCTSLTKAPELPATALADRCYRCMFYGCSKLTLVPTVLPATQLVQYCYGSMFEYCSSLVEAPALPATTLATNCYQLMFSRCTALTNAPLLPATTLASNCYQLMFQYCSNLKTIYCNARYSSGTTSITSSIGTNWLYNVTNSSTCTFYKNPDWTGPTSRGVSTIPSNWKIVNWVLE